jgi:hypothetical protein
MMTQHTGEISDKLVPQRTLPWLGAVNKTGRTRFAGARIAAWIEELARLRAAYRVPEAAPHTSRDGRMM